MRFRLSYIIMFWMHLGAGRGYAQSLRDLRQFINQNHCPQAICCETPRRVGYSYRTERKYIQGFIIADPCIVIDAIAK